MRLALGPIGIACLLSGVWGCSGSEDAPPPAPSSLPPVAVGSRLAYVDPGYALALVIDPAVAPLQARLHAVGENPLLATPRPGHDELLVLSAGVRDQPGLPPEPASLSIIPMDPGQSPRRHTLASRFSALAASPDGRFVVFHFNGPPNVSGDSSLLVNPNEVAVLDLDAPASGSAAASPRAPCAATVGFRRR